MRNVSDEISAEVIDSFGFGNVSRHDDCVLLTGRNHANF